MYPYGGLNQVSKNIGMHVVSKESTMYNNAQQNHSAPSSYIPGKVCDECGTPAVIKVNGCNRCTFCNVIGSCDI